MKKVLSLFLALTFCLFLVGCEKYSAPFNYSSDEALYKIRECRDNGGFLIEYSFYTEGLSNLLFASYNDDDYDFDYDDYDYEDDGYGFNTMSITIAANRDVTYISSGKASIYMDFSDSSKVVIYEESIDSKTKTTKYEKTELDREYSREYYERTCADFYTYLLPHDSFRGTTIIGKTSDLICGRYCDKLSIADGDGKYSEDDGKVVLCLDRELGICLKYGMEYSERGMTYQAGMKCTRFELNPFINFPF